MQFAVFLLFLGMILGTFTLGYRRGFLRYTLYGLAIALVLLQLAVVATATGWRDADGWVDCYDHCSMLQEATGATLVGGAVAGVTFVIVAIGTLLLRRGGSEWPR